MLGNKICWKIKKIYNRGIKPLQTKGFFVLGMHRCGTSCLTGLLETSGLWVGTLRRYTQFNKKGNLENKRIRRCNDHILEQFDGSWNSPPKKIHWNQIDPRPVRQALEIFRTHECWVVKDPRMVLTLEAWLPHVPCCQLVGTFRHPISTAHSLKTRNDMPIEKGITLWVHYNRRLVNLHLKYNFPLLQFDLQGEEYLMQFRSLCQLLQVPFDLKAESDFYEKELITHNVEEGIYLNGEVSEVYKYLISHRIPVATGF